MEQYGTNSTVCLDQEHVHGSTRGFAAEIILTCCTPAFSREVALVSLPIHHIMENHPIPKSHQTGKACHVIGQNGWARGHVIQQCNIVVKDKCCAV